MKNMSIRVRILALVVLVNVIGMMVAMIYLHESYSGGLDVTAAKSTRVSLGAWDEISSQSAEGSANATAEGFVTSGLPILEAMKKISGAEYGLLIDKTALNQAAYKAAMEAAGRPNGWEERDTYVLVASTDEALSQKMQIKATPDSVPEIGKAVGIENGACSQTCHEGVKAQGDFWGVSWSTDSRSRAHAAFPVSDGKGKPVGLVYTIDDISSQADAARGSMMNELLVITITLLVATLAIGGMLDALVFKRLTRMIVSMEDLSVRVAGGDFGAHFEADKSNDEIGKFEQFFAKFMDLMTATIRSLVGRENSGGGEA